VLVDRFGGSSRFSSVSVDSVAGGRMAVEHLIETGRRRIAFVGGPFDIRQVNDRLAGARVAAENAEHVELEVVATAAMTVDEGAAAGARIVSRPRHEWPDALFAANDLIALGLLQEMVRHGVRVPDEFAIVGYDDIDYAGAAAVPLTSVRKPRQELGAAAAELLLDEARSGGEHQHQQRLFQPELVVRESSMVRRDGTDTGRTA